jgi:hypothetical protein
LLNSALFLSRHRVFEAIKALDVAAQDLTACEVNTFFHLGPQPKSLHAAYQELQPKLTELPTVDRCFKVVSAKMTAAFVRDVLRRLRKMYVTMLDVIVATMITTPAAEASGSRRFIRTTTDAKMKKLYPPLGALANAPQGGWWNKNANVHHMKYNTSNLNDGDVITTLIHDMSHFISHNSIYQVGNHHPKGMYNGAFDDTHQQAVRNSFCYEWYAFLASFKSQRSKANSALVLT